MEKEKIISVLRELWRYKDTDKYSESEIRTALESAISALSAEGEYIKKSELMDHVCYCADWSMDFYYVDKDDIEKMQTYSFPGSADMEKARAEIEQFREALAEKAPSLTDLINAQRTVDICLGIINKHIGGK